MFVIKNQKIIQTNNIAQKFVNEYYDNGREKFTNPLIQKAIKSHRKTIIPGWFVQAERAKERRRNRYTVIWVFELKSVEDKLSELRHDIKNTVNPLSILETDAIDIPRVVEHVSELADQMTVQNLF